jgi:hypothetical protein
MPKAEVSIKRFQFDDQPKEVCPSGGGDSDWRGDASHRASTAAPSKAFIRRNNAQGLARRTSTAGNPNDAGK